jgi:hypothetical protein
MRREAVMDSAEAVYQAIMDAYYKGQRDERQKISEDVANGLLAGPFKSIEIRTIASAVERVEALLDRQGWLATAPSMRMEIIAAIKGDSDGV